jgi:hypothetical protein
MNENKVWLEQNYYTMDEHSFLKFQKLVSTILSKSVKSGKILSVHEARREAVKWFV